MANVLVVYYSRSGNTRQMAELIAEGVRQAGKHQVRVSPVADLKLSEFVAAEGYAIGSPDYFTYVAGQVKTLFDEALAEADRIKGKPYVGFVSHGGGGGALDALESLAKAVGLRKAAEGVKSLGAPKDASAREACKRAGVRLAQALS